MPANNACPFCLHRHMPSYRQELVSVASESESFVLAQILGLRTFRNIPICALRKQRSGAFSLLRILSTLGLALTANRNKLFNTFAYLIEPTLLRGFFSYAQ